MSGFTSVWFVERAISFAQQLFSPPLSKTKRGVLIALVSVFVLLGIAWGLGYGPLARNEAATPAQSIPSTITSSTGPAIANGNGSIANTGTIGTINQNPQAEPADKKK